MSRFPRNKQSFHKLSFVLLVFFFMICFVFKLFLGRLSEQDQEHPRTLLITDLTSLLLQETNEITGT
jgi:preprotein translocase subunit SecG